MLVSQNFAPSSQDLHSNGLINTSVADQSEALKMASQAEANTAKNQPVPILKNADDSAPKTASGQNVVMTRTGVDALHRGITQSGAVRPINNFFGTSPPQMASANSQADATTLQTASRDIEPQARSIPASPKKKSIFARLFASQANGASHSNENRRSIFQPQTNGMQTASIGGAQSGLAGKHRSSDFDFEENNVELASAGGMARLAPNGLHLQTGRVKVACLKPKLVHILKSIERHYGKPVIVTSGYRSPRHNRRIGGVSHSRHTTCEAADIQIKGVSKWQLAKYIRSMPGRGGVGTYCHTESVHVDIGTERDWNWRCRRRKN